MTEPKQSAHPKSRPWTVLAWLVIGGFCLATTAIIVVVNCLVAYDIDRHSKQSDYETVER